MLASVLTTSATMRAVTASAFGLPADVLHLQQDVRRPSARNGNEVLIRVAACSMSPGDWRMLSGDAALVKNPKHGFPYVPGGDVCGTVVDATSSFAAGDQVVATWA